MTDLAGRLANRVQLTTDGLKVYIEAVGGAFGSGIDYSQLVKIYSQPPEAEKRYSPPEVIDVVENHVTGMPSRKPSTSYVERQNLTMRMSIRRFTRLTKGFSKKLENHMHAMSLHFMHYNFGRIHETLRITPAMAAGVTDHVWSVEEIAALAPIEAPKRRGRYKKRQAASTAT